MKKMTKRENITYRNKRKAVSPIIATLLLIAIAVAAGIVLYIFVSGLASSLANGGGTQVTEQLSMDSYSFTRSGTTWTLKVTLRNTGTAPVSISSTNVYYDGSTTVARTTSFSGACSGGGSTPTSCTLSPQGFPLSITISAGALNPTPHTSHVFKVVTDDGAVFAFTVIAGQSQ